VKDRQSREPDVAGARKVVDMLKSRGFLTSNAGAYNNNVKLRPPLVFTQQDAEAFIDAFQDVLDHLDH
jgi:4-aminobutyrate aminotransferase-like enzyme